MECLFDFKYLIFAWFNCWFLINGDDVDALGRAMNKDWKYMAVGVSVSESEIQPIDSVQ